MPKKCLISGPILILEAVGRRSFMPIRVTRKQVEEAVAVIEKALWDDSVSSQLKEEKK